MEPEVPAGTFRLRYERTEGPATITGHGTAFAVDLSGYGRNGVKWLLTAAHNVLDDGKPLKTLKVEFGKDWIPCRASSWDADLDICLLESETDPPGRMTLGEGDPKEGDGIAMIGSPKGKPLKEFKGTVTRQFERGNAKSSARIPFEHGDSGGPILDSRGRVVGIAVAGVPKEGDLDKNIGLFVPLSAILAFLDRKD